MSEATLEIPPSEKGKTAAMGDVFKAALTGSTLPANTPAAAPADKPSEKPAATPPEKPAVPEKPAGDLPKVPKTHKDWEALLTLKTKAETEAIQFKSALEPTKAELAKAQKQIEELTVKMGDVGKTQAELEELKKKGSEYENIVKRFYVEHSEEFKSHFNQRLSSAIVEAKEAVGSEHAAKVEEILSYPPSTFRDKQLAEITEELNAFQRARLVNAYSSLTSTERDRQEQLKKAPENWTKLQQVRAKEAQETQAKAAESRTALLAHIEKQIEPELAGVEPALADSIKSTVRKMVNGEIDGEGYVGLLVDSAKGKKYAATVKEKDDTIAKLQAQIQELSAAQPGVLGGTPAGTKKDESVGSTYQKALQGKIKPGWSNTA